MFIFQFLNDKMHNYVKQNISVNFKEYTLYTSSYSSLFFVFFDSFSITLLYSSVMIYLYFIDWGDMARNSNVR